MRFFVLLLALFLSKISFGQDLSLYRKERLIVGTDTLRYRMLLPENYKPNKKYPLVMFLHGSGERGNDNEAQLKHGGSLFIQDSVRKKYPAIVIFPQCPANEQWTDIRGRWDTVTKRQVIYGLTSKSNRPTQLAIQLMQQMIRDKKVDEKRIYLGGLSLGGFGTFALAAEHPDLFAAAFPICGGGEVSLVQRYNPKTAWWLFHGAKDNVVDPQFSRDFYKELKQKGFTVQYTEYPEAEHDSWTQAFKEPQLLPWMFAKKLK